MLPFLLAWFFGWLVACLLLSCIFLCHFLPYDMLHYEVLVEVGRLATPASPGVLPLIGTLSVSLPACVYVFVCVYQKEKACVCALPPTGSLSVSLSAYVCVCVFACVYESERESVCVCVV